MDCRLYCGNCAYYRWNRQEAKYEPCKRIDHDAIQFARPYFLTYTANENRGHICADFRPREKPNGALVGNEWTGFDDYWAQYIENWLPYRDTNILVYFKLKQDENSWYGVRLMDFVNGTMWDGNTLLAIERLYYKRTAKQTGYRLIHQPIEGVLVQDRGRLD